MQFAIDYTGKVEDRLLTYVPEEYAFDINPVLLEINFTIVLNTLNLTVGDHNKIVQVWGYCPHGGWLHTCYSVPENIQGALYILADLESGFSYGINDEEWPVYVNFRTRWVCTPFEDKILSGDSGRTSFK